MAALLGATDAADAAASEGAAAAEEEDPVAIATRAAAAATAGVWDEVDAVATHAGRNDTGAARDEEVVAYGRASVRIAVDWRVGIGGGAWERGLAVCAHLARYEARYRALSPWPLRILELGAGTGIAGLYAGALFRDATVVLTDLGDHLDLLDVNVYRNELQERVRAKVLDWKDASSWTALDDAPDLIVATDCAYHPSLYRPFADVLARACRSRKTTCLVGVTKQDTTAAFYAMLDAAGLEYVLAEEPADSYAALFAIRKARPFGEARDPKHPPWAAPESAVL